MNHLHERRLAHPGHGLDPPRRASLRPRTSAPPGDLGEQHRTQQAFDSTSRRHNGNCT
jgi:hypothetical protein